jgi:hypothetical protein
MLISRWGYLLACMAVNLEGDYPPQAGLRGDPSDGARMRTKAAGLAAPDSPRR